MIIKTIAAVAVLPFLLLLTTPVSAEKVAQIKIDEIGFRGEVHHTPGTITITGKIKKTILGVPVEAGLGRITVSQAPNGDYAYVEKRKLGPFGGKIVMYFKPRGPGRMQYEARLEIITGIKRVHIPGPSHRNYAKGHIYLMESGGPPSPPNGPQPLNLTVRNSTGRMLQVDVRYFKSGRWQNGYLRLSPNQVHTVHRFTTNPTIGVRATGNGYVSDGGTSGQTAANGLRYQVLKYRPGTTDYTFNFRQ